ncbi:MAG: hypothetical protein OXG44_02000 [Gammaproteobacteria bacterium]|nr:hypothetical protein [Gammaproteobacteria bacterium]
MTDVSPDTLSTARRLEQEFGMDRQASEGVAIAIYEHTTANLATKTDVRHVEEKLRGEMRELGASLRGEMNELGASLRGEMNELGASLRGEMNELGASLRGEMNELGASLRGEMNELGATLGGEIRELGTSFRGEIEGSRSYTDANFAQLRAEMHGEFKNLYRHLWLLLLGFAGLIVTLNKLLA